MSNIRVLTIQDISCYGQCSITVALPIISACGIETAILPSAVLSTHTGGFTGYTFRDLTDDLVPIMEHWIKEGIKFDCIYTGYLGSEKQINIVDECRQKLLKDNGLFIVDPVMADNGKFYTGFSSEYAEKMAGLCKKADFVLPNITEACFMTNNTVQMTDHSTEYISRILDSLSELTSGNIILKGVRPGNEKIGIAVRDNKSGTTDYYLAHEEPRYYHGTGDCFASAFCAALLRGIPPIKSAEIASDFIVDCINATCTDDSHFYGVKFETVIPQLINRITEEEKNNY